MQLFDRHVSARSLTVFGGETILISGSMVLAATVSRHTLAFDTVWKILLATAVCELCFYYNDLYDQTIVRSGRELAAHVMQAAGVAAMALALATLAVPSFALGHGGFVLSVCLVLIAIPLWRLTIARVAGDPHLEERVLILGTGPAAAAVAHEIRTQHEYGYRLVGMVSEACAAQLPALVADQNVHRIVVSLEDRRGTMPTAELLHAKLAGIRVEDAATIYERITGKILTDGLKPSWFIFSDGFRASRITRIVKRAIDVVASAIGLMLGAPLMALTALAIWIDDPGPVLFHQERVGANGRVFTLSKFRSMRLDAESGTPIWATDRDTRVTRVGRFIRLARLDELPQLRNVLRGDMSLVGPRPERPYFVERLAHDIPFYTERHAVKPGLTGWAQVKYRYGSTVEDAMEKLRYDLYYIKHLSLVFDLTIAIDTVKVIISGKGAK